MKYLLLILFPLVSISQPKFIFQHPFDAAPVFSSDPTKGFTNWDETCCAWSFTNSDSFKISGKSGRFELRKSDPSPQPNDSKRSQMEWNGAAIKMGATWYAMSIMPAGWMGTDPAPEDLFDLHDKMPNNAPSNWTNPFGIWNENGRWKVHITYSVNPVSSTNQPISKYYDLGQVVPGKWVDWILHTNYSWRDTGYVELYMDGVKVIDYKGPCAYNGALPDPYFKFGIYKWPWANPGFQPPSTQVTRVFYVENLRIGNRSNTINDFLPVPPPNKPPIVNAGLDQMITGTQATLQGTANDPDGDPMTYKWTTVQGNPISSTNPTWTIFGFTPGVYKYEFSATDSKGATGRDTVQVTVIAPNANPIIDSIPAQVVTIPVSTVQVSATARDTDGDSLSYRWDSSGTTVSFMPSFTKKFTNAGTFIFNLTVTDGKGGSATAQAMIIVNPIPPKLIINVGSRIDPKTGGLIVTHYYADGTFKDYQ